VSSDGASLTYVVLGAAAAGERRSREVLATGVRVATVATWPAARVWRSQLASPLRRRTDEASSALARDGSELVLRVRSRARESGGELLRRLGDQMTESGLADEVVDWLLNTGIFDRVVTVIINHPATETLVTTTLDDPALDRLAARVMDSRLVDAIVPRLLESEEFALVLDTVLRSPELRTVLTHQTAGLAEDVAIGMRSRTVRADDAAERFARALLRRPRRREAE
jgi:hypothetical protein